MNDKLPAWTVLPPFPVKKLALVDCSSKSARLTALNIDIFWVYEVYNVYFIAEDV